MSIKTGGPAFPILGYEEGMYLRDCFTAKAMVSRLQIDEFDRQNEILMSQRAYEIADAMLTARGK